MLSNFFNDSKISEKLEAFKNLLVEKNKEFNLTSITDNKEIYIKHFYDSLSGEKFISSGAKVVEIGSGGGFPSVPLKILRDDIDFTLIESVGKKCNFLNLVKNTFNFENFEVKNARCEDLAKDNIYRENFDFSIARAVANLSTLCEYMLPFVKVGGKMIAYKSVNDEEIENAKNAIDILGGKISEIIKYSLPENMGERYLVIIEKIKNTPKKYPRGKGKERSKPL
ncbi:MAG: 16S rRNA (guanine(527)-N(7))-methyltransferase RsmG [Clostridia bacterium]|nr:16S rRNA (guanine(527)-N(7))-methyltransferase RsmG [Clostridia bacterium]